jgi:hypothetical protein
MDVVFRYKNKDGTIMAFSIQENKLYDYITNDTDGVYLDMQDDDIEKMIDALNHLRNESDIREKRNINCGSCKYLIDIDKSQDGGTCQLSGEFHKFHNICDLENGNENT